MEGDGAKTVCVCVCGGEEIVIEKHWRAVEGVPEDGIRERQSEAAGND